MEEKDVINELTGESDVKNQSEKPNVEHKANEDAKIEKAVSEKKKEKELEKAKSDEVDRLADAKNIIKELSIETFLNDDTQIEAQSLLDMRNELGDVKLAEKLERLSIFDKALNMLNKADMADLDIDFVEMLKEITENKRSFDVSVAKNTINIVSKMMDKQAARNIGKNIEVNLAEKGRSMKNSAYFLEEARQRQAKKEREALAFFAQARG